MRIVDVGAGSPVVLIPGIQGRWEWMQPTVEALASSHRVLTFSLGNTRSFDQWDEQVATAMDRANIEGAAVIGVSFGGLIAVHFAARHPARVQALVLVSTPPPAWQLDPVSRFCVEHPFLGLPVFSVRGFFRLAPEILRARPSWRGRLELAATYAGRVVKAPVSPAEMSRYVRAWRGTTFIPQPDALTMPTLVVTGEKGMDRVVPVEQSLQYLTLIPGARHTELQGTGHVGVVTKPRAFADTVDRFLADASRDHYSSVRHAS